jgi:hypothetical protein
MSVWRTWSESFLAAPQNASGVSELLGRLNAGASTRDDELLFIVADAAIGVGRLGLVRSEVEDGGDR